MEKNGTSPNYAANGIHPAAGKMMEVDIILSDSSVHDYLIEIAQKPLFTNEEEYQYGLQLSELRQDLDLLIYSSQPFVMELAAEKYGTKELSRKRRVPKNETSKEIIADVKKLNDNRETLDVLLDSIAVEADREYLINKIKYDLPHDLRMETRLRFYNVLNAYEDAIKRNDADDIVYFKNLTDIPRNKLAQYKEKFEKAKDDYNAIKTTFVEHNLKLAHFTAKRYLSTGVPMDDLLPIANFGLLRAPESFEVELGNKFSTYAMVYIKQALGRDIEEYKNVIRLPVHVAEKTKKILKAAESLGFEIYYITDEEIKQIASNIDMPLKIVTNLLVVNSNRKLISLDKELYSENQNDRHTLSDYFLIEQDSVEDNAIEESKKTELYDAFERGNLTDREKEVLELRFGLISRVDMTLEEVGRNVSPKITRERVRQIEAEALKKLRSDSLLEDFVL